MDGAAGDDEFAEYTGHHDAGFEGVEEPAQPVIPSAAELKRQINDWRRGRATRNLWEAFSDAYIAVIAALMIGGALVNVVFRAQRVVAQCTSEACLSARTVLPWAAFALAVALALAVSRLFGPVLASAAEGFWLLDTPVRRARLLGPRLVAALVVALVVGALVGAAVTALTGGSVLAIAVWSSGTALAAMAAVSCAAAQQGGERDRMTQIAGYLFWVLGLAALVTVIGIDAGWFSLGLSADLDAEIGLAVVAVAAVILAVSLVLAVLRLSRIRRVRLVSGGALVKGISGAFFALDFGLARDIVVARRAVAVGQVTPRRGHGLGRQALVWREWQRLRRFPQPLFVLAATLIVPYACDALGMSTLTPVVAALALFGASIQLLGGLRVLTRTGGLARCLPFSLAQLKISAVTVPAIVVAIWAVLTVPAYLGFGDGAATHPASEAGLMAIATAAAGLLAAIRWTQAKGPDFSAPMISTPSGAFPPGLMSNVFRGFDVCLIATAPMLLGFSPMWSLAICAIAALILLNSMDAESLRARQAEQQKELERAKKQRAAAAATERQRKR
ncbi:MAG: DUF6297 family protein [Microlunatus sp.]|nr:DUF6297 family protein [Microlunatus sp.]